MNCSIRYALLLVMNNELIFRTNHLNSKHIVKQNIKRGSECISNYKKYLKVEFIPNTFFISSEDSTRLSLITIVLLDHSVELVNDDNIRGLSCCVTASYSKLKFGLSGHF